jgi:hypothetical protein
MRCTRCSKPFPDSGVVYYRGLPFGSYCHKVLFRRFLLRSHGTGVRFRLDSRLNMNFWSSQESDQVCPDPQVHCISCTDFHKKSCTLEQYIQANGGGSP